MGKCNLKCTSDLFSLASTITIEDLGLKLGHDKSKVSIHFIQLNVACVKVANSR